MTQLAYANRVQEWATNVGAGAVALQGASSPGLRSFAAGALDGKTVPYAIQHRTANQWECGYGVYTAPGTLTRLVVLSNSLGTTNLVAFAAGIVDVGNEQLAERIVSLATDLSLTVPGAFGFTGALTMGGHSYTPPAALPAADGYALVATAAGVMSWAPMTGGGGGGGALLTFGANLTGGSFDGSAAKTIAVSATPTFTTLGVSGLSTLQAVTATSVTATGALAGASAVLGGLAVPGVFSTAQMAITGNGNAIYLAASGTNVAANGALFLGARARHADVAARRPGR